MLTRITHAGIAFAITVVAYQGYVLALAPFVEPLGVTATIAPLSLEQLAQPPASLETTYRPLLAAYFPADHWCFQRLPIIIENSQAMVVVGEYSQNQSGELRVPQVALVFFPTPRDPAADPPRDAIIMEPAGGATLQMDQQIGKGRGLGAMGRMQFGQLLGAVTVRSDMKEPGPQDDLRIDTRDLYMNEELIRTAETVTMRLGPHRGRGRGLEIRFFKTQSSSSAAPATLFGKLDSLEISREVAAEIMPGKATLFGEATESSATAGLPAVRGGYPVPTAGQASSGAPAAGNARANKFTDAPARITCTGPFRIEFSSDLASFTENVLVRQLHPGGELDEMHSNELTLYFASTQEWGGDVTPTGAPSAGSIRLEPATVEAVGTPESPVALTAASQGAAARGERLRIDLIQRQVQLDGGDEVWLNYRGAEIKAPMIQYDLPPENSGRRLGLMSARGGSGSLTAAPDPRRPGEVLKVRWTQSMQMARRGEQTVLQLDGRPRVEMVGLGTLWADRLELALREIAANAGAATAGQDGVLPSTIHAEQVLATGNVGIESAEINGKVDRLDLRIFDPQLQPAGPATAGGVVTSARGGQGNAGPGAPSTGPASFFDPQRGRGPLRTYFIKGRVLEIDAVVRDRRPQVGAIRVDGGVDFQETTPGAAGEAPLRILAEHLNVSDADTADAKIEIRGGDATGALPAGLATIAARGTVMRAPTLAINRGTSRAWINSPGEVQMLMTRDMNGQPLATPQQLQVTWRDSMDLDRDRITFQGNVFVQHADGWLRTERLVVVLTAPVSFDGAGAGRPPEAAQLECCNGVNAEFEQRDPTGAITSHQVIKLVQRANESFVVNLISGALRGDGEGHVDSVHLSKGDGSWAELADPKRPPGVAPQVVERDAPGPPQLRHLSVDFVRGVEGNIHAPQRVRVFGNVRTIYGPVAAWDQRLEMAPGSSPGEDTFWLTCDSLEVNESPLTQLQPPGPDGKRRKFGLVELKAEGNVSIEGVHPTRGAFTLRGALTTYDQAKTLFMLKGDANASATVTYQQFPGGPFQTQSAKEMSYNVTSGAATVIGFDKLSFEQFNQ